MIGFCKTSGTRQAHLFVREPQCWGDSERGIDEVYFINLSIDEDDVRNVIDDDEFGVFRDNPAYLAPTATDFFWDLRRATYPTTAFQDLGNRQEHWRAMAANRVWKDMNEILTVHAYAWTILEYINEDEFEILTGLPFEEESVSRHRKLVISEFLACMHEIIYCLPGPELDRYADAFDIYRLK